MELDGKLIKKHGHDYLMEKLDLPVYYGMNLDALFDCLCEMNGEITIINSKEIDKDTLDTFTDASLENDFLTVTIR